MDTKVITGRVRFCYCNVFEPKAMNEGDDPKYSVCILIRKDDEKTLAKVKDAVEAAKEAYKAKLAGRDGKVPSNIKTPLRDGDIDRPDDPAFENCYFINASSNRAPGIVDANREPIMTRDEFYSGCYGRASLNLYGYNVTGSKGIAAGLNNLQKLADGPVLAGGSSAEADFADAEDDEDMM